MSLNRQVSDVTLITTKRKPFDALVETAQMKPSRADCPDFEPLVTAFVEIALSNSPFSPNLAWVTRLSAWRLGTLATFTVSLCLE